MNFALATSRKVAACASIINLQMYYSALTLCKIPSENINKIFTNYFNILKITISERTSHEQYLFLVQSFLARESILKYVVKTKVIVKLPYEHEHYVFSLQTE